ncbi:MAG TPA: DUF6152 family protein [Noviherbaspirillum sp.]|uniref:DUF6152 family protein n=1 Tax=Noviherbaspirillum sp. TaxID=1926288 RepID=UPI002D69891B|nr:DUF6152 family protein [Noviherbaspirillum sp.]HYD94108.1 DUF6152 family protein [Noviherbaspirillum sp.]
MKRFTILAMLFSMPAFAHHGWSEYDADRPLQLTGTVEESGYEHPHGFVRLKTTERTWTVVLAPPTRMQNRGLEQAMLAPGGRATVYGYPNRNNDQELRAERITLGGKTTELR